MSCVASIPDVDTIAGLIRDLIALITRQFSESIGEATWETVGIEKWFVVEGIRRCFGVQVPLSEFRPSVGIGQLCHNLAEVVNAALAARTPLAPRSAATPRLLLIGAGVAEHEQAIARRGWRGTMLSHYDEMHTSGTAMEASGVIDEVEAVDWGKPADVVQRIVELCADGHSARVVPVGEFGLLPAALATTQLGIPGLSVGGVWNTRDKLRMRRVLEDAGLGQVRYAACPGFAEAEAFLEKVGGPIILKPVSGTASDGVSLVAGREQLAAAFELAAGADGFRGILCEEYIEGPEVSLEGYSVDGRFIPVALTDKLIDEYFLEIGHQQPTSHPEGVFESATSVAGRALAALGVVDGVTHTEFKITQRGPVLIETHTRMAGDYIHLLTQLTTGVDLADVVVAFSIGEVVNAHPVPQGRAAAIRFLVGRPGRIRAVKLPALTNEIHSVVSPPVGKLVKARSASWGRLGHVIATGPTAELAAKAAESFASQIHIEYFAGSSEVAARDRVAAAS